jgi:phosphoribosylamine--glycine ligase
LLEVLEAAVNNKLATVQLKWSKQTAACVVVSSRGYPGTVDERHGG